MRLRFLVSLLACTTAFGLFGLDETIRTANGPVTGGAGRNAEVRVYKGLPYAAPPIGQLRWKSPRPAASWVGVRKADQFSAACMQAPYPPSSIYHSDPEPTSEDCLYLNVWTAAKTSKERRPVMVWVHGGALTRGSGALPTYDGESLARKGVVVVTINYRLGVFGFFAHPELTKESDRNASGNYGLLDQIAALEWVQKNIAAFGGDPKRVTIFGESAGSWSVNYLMATPLAHGLFHRVIGESGGAFGPMKKLSEVEESGVKFAHSLEVESLAALRAKTADELLKASGAASFPPNVDGWLLPQDVYTIFASGKQNDVPILVGSNADEAKSLTMWPPGGTTSNFVSGIKMRFGADTDKVLRLYPASTDDEAKASFYTSFTDYVFTWQMRTWARLQNKSGKSKAYLYYFDRVPPGPAGERYGAYHAAEIAYVFDNLDSRRKPIEEADRKLADVMSSYWVNFAATGDPNGKGLPKWGAYLQSNDTALELGDRIQPIAGLHKDALDFLDEHMAAERAKQPGPTTPSSSAR